ncbi:MAG: YqhA family protein [Muribaculaceae bacterium]|nr:YqhA family protein [Muribaculaceae bacterium]
MSQRTLQDVRQEILRTRKVTPEILKELEDIYADLTQIDFDKADVLFRIKQLNHIELTEKYKDFFVDRIASFLLGFGQSPDEIDAEEGKWLRGRIIHRDEYDRALLEELENRLENIDRKLPNYLKKNNYLISRFEDILYYSRYFSFIAVVGAILSSFILFIQGFGLIIKGLVGFFHNPTERYEALFEQLVSSVDVFLFALVLIIFGVGVYELFIANIDPEDKPADTRPTWLKISSVDDLKSSLGKVILMVLIVSFFKHVLEISAEMWSPTALLYLAIGILLIAGALYLTHKSGSETERSKSKENSSIAKELLEETL